MKINISPRNFVERILQSIEKDYRKGAINKKTYKEAVLVMNKRLKE